MPTLATVKLTANFERNLLEMESFVVEAEAPQMLPINGAARLVCKKLR